MNPQLIVAAVLVAFGFGTGWTVQGWRYGAKEREHVEQALAAERLAATTDVRRQEDVIAAQNAAETRARGLRVDAAGARDALVGLSDAADAALRSAAATHAACLERANTLDQLLQASAGEYRNLAEKADRHASDVQTLTAAWPK